MSNNKHYYQFDVEQTLQSLNSKREGLSSSDSVERLELYGKNKLLSTNKKTVFLRFFSQLKDLMVVLLIIAGSISLYLNEYRDASIMFILVFVNALIGFFQEYKAERMIDSLKTMIATKAKVLRDGKEIEILSEELVPGDIVVLEEGDAVPADIRMVEENNFGTNDFALTGESNPTKKFIHAINGVVQLADRNNLIFMGTTVAIGNAVGVVIHTGMDTEIGRLANLSQETVADLSPLQKELNTIAKKLSIIALIIAGFLFVIGLLIDFTFRESLLFALGMAVSMVPEGLPAQVTIALSLAASRLAKDNAIVKKLSAVETLGSTHIICTDKTGTLTKNEMTVQKLFIGYRELDVTGLGYEPKGNVTDTKGTPLSKEELQKYQLFFETGLLVNNAKVDPPDAEHPVWYAIGDPTEAALITLSEKALLKPDDLQKKYEAIKQFPFDAVRKRMSSVRKKDGKIIVYVKGSPQGILERCTQFYDEGKVRPLSSKDKEFIKKQDDVLASMAMRNLAYAYAEIPKFDPTFKMEDVEQNLVWLGLVSMIDPLREEVKDAVDSALKANIRVIIITGDYALTAEAIAKKIGLNKNKDDDHITVVNGKDLQFLSDIDLLHKLINTNIIFARTSPEDKLRIVALLKKAGEVVAVTGDGVNDAPCLKKADIGLAMGKTGTEVAKDSAEIILLDDSFATIVTAIKEGRTIFQNLKKTILSSITSNCAEVFVILLSLAGTIIFHYPMAILVVQILAIDLIGEMLPLIFLTFDPSQKEIMTAAPRNPSDHILKKGPIIDLLWSGCLMGGLGYVNFLIFYYREGLSPTASVDPEFYMRATTLTYITIVFAQWMNILSRRTESHESIFHSYVWSNKKLLLSYGFSLIFLLNIVYNPYVTPFLQTASLSLADWGFAVLGSLVFLAIREIYKQITKPKEVSVPA